MINLKKFWQQQPQGNLAIANFWRSRAVVQAITPSAPLGVVPSPFTSSGTTGRSLWDNELAFSHSSSTILVGMPSVGAVGTSAALLLRFRTKTNTTGATLSGFGSDGGSSGNTLVSFATGSSNAANLRCIFGGNNNNVGFDCSGTVINDGEWHTAIMLLGNWGTSAGKLSCETYLDGVFVGSGNDSGGNLGTASYTWLVSGGVRRGGSSIVGVAHEVSLIAAIHTKITPFEAVSLTLNPWQLFEPSLQTLPLFGGGGSYTLSADVGSYSIFGQAATLLKSKVVTANNGFYAVTGQDTIITYGSLTNYTLTANHGTYAVTGQSATLLRNKVVSASHGTYSLAGQAATVAYSGSNTITLKAGSWLRYRIIQ